MKIEVGTPAQSRPESGWSFALEYIGGEMVMPQKCPEIERGAVAEILERANCRISLGTISGWDGDAGTPARVLAARNEYPVVLAPPPASPANGSGAGERTWCQARVLISGELLTGHGCGVAGRVSAIEVTSVGQTLELSRRPGGWASGMNKLT